jgi:hypothetical protein
LDSSMFHYHQQDHSPSRLHTSQVVIRQSNKFLFHFFYLISILLYTWLNLCYSNYQILPFYHHSTHHHTFQITQSYTLLIHVYCYSASDLHTSRCCYILICLFHL